MHPRKAVFTKTTEDTVLLSRAAEKSTESEAAFPNSANPKTETLFFLTSPVSTGKRLRQKMRFHAFAARFLNFSISSAGSAAPNTALPATKMFAPASAATATVFSLIPPST